MDLSLRSVTYSDYKVYSVMKIKGSYGFRVKLIYGDEDYIIQQKSGFKTRKEAEDKRNELIGQLESRTYVVKPRIKVKDFYTYWLEKEVKKLEYNSYMSYRNIVNNYIVKEWGSKNMTSLNQSHILKLYKKITRKSESVARLAKTVVNKSMKYAKSRNIISIDISEYVNLPKTIKKKPYRQLNIDSSETYTVEQVLVLINGARGTPIYLQVMFAVLMGFRISEICALKYSDLDLPNQRIYAKVQLGRRNDLDSKNVKPKTVTKQEKKMKSLSSKRWIEIPDVLFNAVLEERTKYEKNKKRRINDKTNPFQDDGYICCSTYGKPRCRNYYYRHYVDLIDRLGLPYICFHKLRNTYTTVLLRNGFSPKAVSKLLGHSSEVITVDWYYDKSIVIQDCLDKLEPYIEEVAPKEEPKICDYSNLELDMDSIYEGIMKTKQEC